jgi:hypothetical protein
MSVHGASRHFAVPRNSVAIGDSGHRSSRTSTFDVKPGDAIYLAPEQRISLWQVDREVVCKEKPH